MRSRAAWLSILAALVTAAVLLQGCGAPKSLSEGGTGTGNPTASTSALYSQSILETLCHRFSECFGSEALDRCRTVGRSARGIDEALGLPAGSYADWGALIEAEAKDKLRVSSRQAAIVCLDEISRLECLGQNVVFAFDSGFTALAEVMPSGTKSCKGVFR